MMTNNEKQSAILEACGWVYYDGWHHPDGREEVPDYLNDLNAAHEMEKLFYPWGSTKWEIYTDYLTIACIGSEQRPISATAAQRADAFLLTKGFKP